MNTTSTPPLLILENISKRFLAGPTSIDAVKTTNLTIGKGQFIAIVGPSGSGKTTLSHIIGGLLRPSEGTLEFEGKKLNLKNDRAVSRYRNKSVGFIFQNYHLLPHYTALENVTVPLIVANTSVSRRQALAKEKLDLMGLSKQQHQRANQLSGGQKQRVAIARALVTQPQIIIADEPTGNLDSKHGEEIMKTLEYLAHQENITVIMVTHNTAMAHRADRILSIQDGEVKELPHARA